VVRGSWCGIGIRARARPLGSSNNRQRRFAGNEHAGSGSNAIILSRLSELWRNRKAHWAIGSSKPESTNYEPRTTNRPSSRKPTKSNKPLPTPRYNDAMLLLILALWLETHSPTPLAAISAAEHSVLDAVGTKEKTIVATPATPSQHQETRATWQKNAIQPTRPIEPESASEFLWPNTRKTPQTNVRAPKPALRGPPPAESTQTNATPVIYARIELDSPVAPNNAATLAPRQAPPLAQAGDDLFVGTYSQSYRANRLAGTNQTHTPHHVIQDALSQTTRARGVTINLRQDLHQLTRTFRRPVEPGLNLRTHLARDVMDLRRILRDAGYDPAVINRQLQELIRQNKALGGLGKP